MFPPELTALFRDRGPVHFAYRCYAMSCVVHRLLKFGWEEQVNLYSPRELVLLGHFVPPGPSQQRVFQEAVMKAEATGDTAVLAFFADILARIAKAQSAAA